MKNKNPYIGSATRVHISKELSTNPELRELFFEAQEKRKLAVCICHLRKQMGLTQKDLAKMAGVNQSYIARIEKPVEAASGLPSLDAYLHLLNILGYRIDVRVKKIKLAA